MEYFFRGLKFTTFITLLSHTMLLTLLILAVCRARVTTHLVNMTYARHEFPMQQVFDESARPVYGRSCVR